MNKEYETSDAYSWSLNPFYQYIYDGLTAVNGALGMIVTPETAAVITIVGTVIAILLVAIAFA